jgi:tetratricopeptide (TPR) repeat protein
LGRGDCDCAIEDFNRAIALDPGFGAAYTDRGQAYYKKIEQYRAMADEDIEIGERIGKEQRAERKEQREERTVRGWGLGGFFQRVINKK